MMPYPGKFWFDHPAVFHGKGSGLSFVDGHCDFWQWSDQRTWTFDQGYDQVNAEGSPDLRRLQGAQGINPPPVQ